jgi:SNF2 family DNA or RNA helicase
VLESYGIGTRLARGRSYANSGKVLSLELNQGQAVAKVKGNYRPFYQVRIIFPPLEEAEQVYRMIDDDPPLLARIAAGELPEAFLKKLIANNIGLIPYKWRDMERSCTGPDEYGDPGKHMAALYYIIAKEIDADPNVLFRLRGIDLTERFGKAAVREINPPFTVTFAADEKPVIDRSIDLEEIPLCVDLITALLPPAPPFCGRDFAVVMAEFFHRAARYRSWESAGADANANMEHQFSRSAWNFVCANPGPGAEMFLDAEDINGNVRRFTVYDAFEYFVCFSSEDGTASYSFLFYLFKFLNLVCSSGAFIPYVFSEKGTLKIIWRPFETLPAVLQILDSLASRESGMLKIAAQKKTRSVSGRSVVDLLASAFLNEWVHRRSMFFRGNFAKITGKGAVEYQELLDLFFLGAGIDVKPPARRSLPQAIDRWLSVLHINFTAYNYNLSLKELNSKNGLLYYSLSMEVITEDEDGTKKTPLSKVRDLEILRAPIALSNYLPEIRSLTGRLTLRLSEARLISFLDSAASLLTRLGMTVTLPKSLHRELKPRLLVKSSAKSLKRYFDLNSLQDFEWRIAIGDEVLTLKEFEKLVNEKRSLVRFRDGYVKIDTEELSRLLKKAKNSEPDFNDFLRAHFSGDSVLSFDAREIIDNLFREQDLPVPPALNAELRPYQKRGYNWICSLLFSGFGCILADDMGLGKTVQSITVLLRLKKEGLLKNGCLVVAPASLLSNWEKELDRFAPSLNVSRYHGHNRILNRKFDVFLTTYQTAVRDAEKLKDVAFSVLLVDEAHLMKNAETRVARTVKILRSQYRLALSGTPVENRLEDLRSLFDFILPGYLGTAASFRELYRVPIEVMRSHEQAEILRRITAPFLLRRLKTDKSIIRDLPEKIVTNEYAVLEKEQAALYKSVVDDSMEKSANTDPRERSSLVLALLTSLKQICDHPRVYDKQSPAASKLSGKAQLLLTLLEEILVNREKALVFSQYVETLNCLERIIKNELGEAPLLFHGGLNQNARSRTINNFQNDPAARILLVSLKAGGLGLNLTGASRVIHYDLWYNPAVENQATDRAFRIGQKRTVFVHRFITKNSFEEKIDTMLSSKQELADMTIKSGESWLARMSHEELRALFEKQ